MKNDLLNKFVNEINELFGHQPFHKEYIKYLKSDEKNKLELYLKKKFEGEGPSDGLIGNMLSTLGHYASSINYDSPTLGKWVRIRVMKNSIYDPCFPGSNISHSETEFHEQLHRTAPRQRNLLFSDDLKKTIQVQFGGSKKPNREDIFYVSRQDWSALHTEISGKRQKSTNSSFIDDLKKFILAEPNGANGYIYEQHCTNAVKALIKKFESYLADHLVEERRRNWKIKKEEGENFFRLFVFTYFYTIKLYPKNRVIYHLIIPLREADNPVGSYCGAFQRDIKKTNIDSMQKCVGILIQKVYTLECIAYQKLETRNFSSATGENIIRLCAFVPKEGEIPNEMKRLYNQMKQLGSSCESTKGDCDLDLITEDLVSADPIYLSMVKELWSYAKACGLEKGKCVLLYGEAGLGKGCLAKLLHYSSPRSDVSKLQEVCNRELDRFAAEYYAKNGYKKITKEYEKDFAEHHAKWKESKDASQNSQKEEDKKNFQDERRKMIEINFMEEHASQLKVGKLEWFLGSNTIPGRLSILNLWQGTLFLDELHTIDPDVLLELHRVWGKPYEIKPVQGRDPIGINVFTIFASNKSPQQLKDMNFDPALLSRIGQFAREIPPLRKRKQDIALLVNHFIRTRHNKDATPSKPAIRFIDPDGLRLLTELRWKDTNVRGVIQFIDDFLQDRKQRKVESTEISFDEIMSCVRRR